MVREIGFAVRPEGIFSLRKAAGNGKWTPLESTNFGGLFFGQNVGSQLRTNTERAQSKTVAEQVTLETKPNELNELGKIGRPPETRTPDPLIKSQLLYQLS